MLRKKWSNLLRSSCRNDEKESEELSDISDISSPELPEAQPSKRKKKAKKRKRNKFTYSEDKKMLNYIMTENRYNEIKGIALWKDMEILTITNHTKQSMKDRFIKKVIPNLHQYDVNPSWFKRLQRLYPDILKKIPDKENAKSSESSLPGTGANSKEHKGQSSRLNFSSKNSKGTGKSRIEEDSSSCHSEEGRTHTSSEGENTEATFPRACLLRSSGRNRQTNRKRQNTRLNLPRSNSKVSRKSKVEEEGLSSDDSEEKSQTHTSVEGENSDATIPYRGSPRNTRSNSKTQGACSSSSVPSAKDKMKSKIERSLYSDDSEEVNSGEGGDSASTVPIRCSPRNPQSNRKTQSARLNISAEIAKDTKKSKTDNSKKRRLHASVESENGDATATIPYRCSPKSSARNTRTNCDRLNISRQNSEDTRNSRMEEGLSSDDSEEGNMRTTTEGLYELSLRSSAQITRANYNNSSPFHNSLDAEMEEGREITVVPNSAPTPKTSSSIDTVEDCQSNREKTPDEQSDELSDYDQYLIGIAKKSKPSRKLSSSSSTSPLPQKTNKSPSSSDRPHHTNQSMERSRGPSEDKEINESSEESVLPDRRARLQRRRQMRKSKQFSDDYEETSEKTTPSTSQQKKKRKRNITDYLTISISEKSLPQNEEDGQPNSEEENPEEPMPSTSHHHNKKRKTSQANCPTDPTSEIISNENEDADVQDESSKKLNHYDSIISNISTSYGLTKREVLFTIFCFNGDIDKTISYLRLGPELSHLNPWSPEEDRIISSTDEASINKVLKQRGNKVIAERLGFLEHFSDYMT